MWLGCTRGTLCNLCPCFCLFIWSWAISWASLVAQRLKHLPAMWKTWVQSLGWEDPLEKEMLIHSSILDGESHGRRSLVDYSPWGCKEWDTTERLHFHFHLQSGTMITPTFFLSLKITLVFQSLSIQILKWL